MYNVNADIGYIGQMQDESDRHNCVALLDLTALYLSGFILHTLPYQRTSCPEQQNVRIETNVTFSVMICSV